MRSLLWQQPSCVVVIAQTAELTRACHFRLQSSAQLMRISAAALSSGAFCRLTLTDAGCRGSGTVKPEASSPAAPVQAEQPKPRRKFQSDSRRVNVMQPL